MLSSSLLCRRFVALALLAIAAPCALAQTFNNFTPITIPTIGSGSPYPSTISVAGVPTVSNITVSVSVTHPYISDLELLLVSPSGKKILLLSDAGASTSVTATTFSFSPRSYLPSFPSFWTPSSGTNFRPTDNVAGDVLPAPAPAGPYTDPLSSVLGLSGNGVWSLYVADDESPDGGTIQSWSITLNGADPITAEPGTRFTYQGKLESGGSPVNGLHDMTFSLWSSDTGTSTTNNLSGPISVPNVQVTNGLFTAEILVPPLPSYTGSRLWLQIAAGPAGSAQTTLSPRQQLTPTPFAVRARIADDSDQLGGRLASAFLRTGGYTTPDAIFLETSLDTSIISRNTALFSGDGANPLNPAFFLVSRNGSTGASPFFRFNNLGGTTIAELKNDGNLAIADLSWINPATAPVRTITIPPSAFQTSETADLSAYGAVSIGSPPGTSSSSWSAPIPLQPGDTILSASIYAKDNDAARFINGGVYRQTFSTASNVPLSSGANTGVGNASTAIQLLDAAIPATTLGNDQAFTAVVFISRGGLLGANPDLRFCGMVITYRPARP